MTTPSSIPTDVYITGSTGQTKIHDFNPGRKSWQIYAHKISTIGDNLILEATGTNSEIFFLMGADSLINFHKWHKWEMIAKKCNLIVFDRYGYKKKSLNSISFKRLKDRNLKFIEFNKVKISSSQLRKI